MTTMIRRIVVIAAFLVVLAACAPPSGSRQDTIYNTTNNYRTAHGLAPEGWSVHLADDAQTWSLHLAIIGRLEHSDLFWTLNTYGLTACGENIAVGPPGFDVVGAWSRSPGHDANLLGDFTMTGIGVTTANGQEWVVAQYCR